MASSLFGSSQKHLNQNQINQIKNLVGSVKGKSNAMTLLTGMLGNSTVGNVLNLARQGNPKDMFYQKCKEMNIDPEEILSLLK